MSKQKRIKTRSKKVATGKFVPSTRPQIARSVVEAIQKKSGVTDSVSLLGIRGYYLDSMGARGKNERGIYDDAIVCISPEGCIAFNANVDPSIYRKNVASLKKGRWRYKIGIHGLSKPKAKRYKALVQAAKVTVVRDGAGEHSGFFGINIHHGSLKTTSSLGCQTIFPTQWSAFIALVESEMKRHGQSAIDYNLIDQSDITG